MLLYISKFKTMLDRKCQYFPFLTTGTEMFETPALINCYLCGCGDSSIQRKYSSFQREKCHQFSAGFSIDFRNPAHRFSANILGSYYLWRYLYLPSVSLIIDEHLRSCIILCVRVLSVAPCSPRGSGRRAGCIKSLVKSSIKSTCIYN